MASTHLKRITTRAQQLRRAKPGMKWQNAIKAAARDIGKPRGVGSVKKKKAGSVKPKAKKRVTVVNIGSTKKRKKTMAKTKKRRTSRRRSGIGGFKMSNYTSILMQIGGAVAGGVLVGATTNMLSQHIKNPKAVAGVQLIGGAILARSMAKHPLVSGVGLGIAAAGGASLLRQSGFLKGIGESDYLGDDDYMRGTDDDANGLAGDDDGLGDDDGMSGDDDL